MSSGGLPAAHSIGILARHTHNSSLNRFVDMRTDAMQALTSELTSETPRMVTCQGATADRIKGGGWGNIRFDAMVQLKHVDGMGVQCSISRLNPEDKHLRGEAEANSINVNDVGLPSFRALKTSSKL